MFCYSSTISSVLLKQVQKFPFFVATEFTNIPGQYVKLADTIEGFKAIINGHCDKWPEQAFLNVGKLEQAEEKAMKLMKD